MPILLLLLACRPQTPPSEPTAPATSVDPFPLPPNLEAAPPASARLPADSGAAHIQTATQSWFDAHPGQRIYIQTDKPLYRPGETVWIKTWDVQTRDFSGSLTPRAATYELVSPKGDVVQSKRVEEKNGKSNNDFILGGGLAGGEYTLRVRAGQGTAERHIILLGYEPPRIKKTLDFLRDAYGEGDTVAATISVRRPTGEVLAARTLTAVVVLDGAELTRLPVTTDAAGEAVVSFALPAEITTGDALLTVMVDDGGVTESISRKVPIKQNLTFTAYPEGGDLVVGLSSRVYFEALDSFGKPADVQGEVRDAAGTVVTTFRSVHDGLGRFTLTPKAGETYTVALSKPEGNEAIYPLPTAQEKGCVLRHYDDFLSAEAAIRVGVSCTEDREVYVVGTQREQQVDNAKVEVEAGEETVVYLKNATLSTLPGAARVTVFDADFNAIAERLVFRNRDRQLKVEVVPDKTAYGPRDTVTLTVRTTDPEGKPVAAEVALSVVDDTVISFADDKQGHILSRLLLEPELSGTIEEPKVYFDKEKAESAYAVDLLMGTRGWRRFEWTPVLHVTETKGEAHVKKEEGKVGKSQKSLRARSAKTEVNAPAPAAPLAEDPAVLGALKALGYMEPPPLDEPPAPPGLAVKQAGLDAMANEDQAGIAGVLGVIGDGEGGRGLIGVGTADQIVGLGGGGTAEGLGGLGRRGSGSGAPAGFGQGGGNFGQKAEMGKIQVGDPIILGSLDQALISTVVRRNINAIRYCYQRELVKTPALQGKVTIKFVIAADGTVSSATVKQSTMGSQNVETCLTGRFMRMQFPEPKGGGIVIVSYPFTFSANGADRLPAAAPAAPTYATVRVFPVPRHDPATPRSDFRDTIYWAPAVVTDEKGEASVSFPLSDAVTSFRVFAEGIGAGLAGRLETVLKSSLPFSMDLRLPVEVSQGDRLLLPLTLSNERDVPLNVNIKADFANVVKLMEPPKTAVELTAGQRQSLFYPLEVVATEGTGEVRIRSDAGLLTDTLTRTLTVVPDGFPQSWSNAGQLEKKASANLNLSAAIPGSIHATVKLYPSSLSDVASGLESLLRMPNGCFEQASSSNYPNVLALQLLRAQPDAGLAEKSRSYLEGGYQKLVGYASSDGGYEWFGGSPGHEALTAYGLVQFTDMKEVYSGVESAMIERTAAWLKSRRDGEGGYQRNERALDSFGRASPEVTNAYITWALTESGQGSGLDVELKALMKQGETTADPYVLALAANALLNQKKDASGLVKRLSSMQQADGSWQGMTHSVTRSTGVSLHIETTALAMLAMLKADNMAAVERGMGWMMTQRSGGGRWGSTQSTILALKALSAYSAQKTATDVPGTVIIRVNGANVGSLHYGPEQRGTPTSVDLAKHLTIGDNRVELLQDGGRVMPYSIGADWFTLQPASSPDVAVDVEVELADTDVKMGESVRLTATIENRTAEGLPMTLARIGVPAGLSFQSWQLDDLKDRKVIDFYETRGREVFLYFRSLAPSATLTVPIDLLATTPGTYSAPASRAYLYYTDEKVDWEAPLKVIVQSP